MILVVGACGYLGSRFCQDYRGKYEIVTVDSEWFGNNITRYNLQVDYSELPANFFHNWDAIVLLAGHSSVAMAKNEPLEALDNNVVSFANLLAAIPPEVKLIYASSSSVYNGKVDATEEISLDKSTNIYDYTKVQIDEIARRNNKKTYGLRFGTINGASLNFRPDLMINKMVMSALENGFIDVYGPGIVRPILDIQDACSAISTIIDEDVEPGIYNVATFHSTVGEMAEGVSKQLFEVPIYQMGDSPAYDFSIDCSKLQSNSSWIPRGTLDGIISDIETNQKEWGVAREFSKRRKMSLLR